MKKITGFLAAATLLVACGDDASNEDTTAGNETTAGETEDTTSEPTGGPTGGTDDPTDPSGETDDPTGETDDPTGDTEDPPTGCADPNDAGARMGVSADIDGDMTFTCDTVWVLEDIVFVRNGNLTIEPGTTILGADGAALVIDTTATLTADGQSNAPIVMTSIQPEGSRNPGDWGGVVLLGLASTNVEGGSGLAEGFTDPPSYGGDAADHNCGSLSYLRIEWASSVLAAGSEINGLTFYSCGTQTTAHHIQVHRAADDGIEFFGGGFDLDHIIVTGAIDDSIDVDEGFQGNFTDVFVQQAPDSEGSGLEWSNGGASATAEPRTVPTICNATIVGAGAGAADGIFQEGALFKDGTRGSVQNSIISEFAGAVILIEDDDTTPEATSGELSLSGVVHGNNGDASVPDGFDAAAFVMDTVAADPMLTSTEWTNPDITPADGSPIGDAGTGADCSTSYAGAIDPAGENWTLEGWTNYGV